MFFLDMHLDIDQNHKSVPVGDMECGESKPLGNILLLGKDFPSFLPNIHKLVLDLTQYTEHFVHILFLNIEMCIFLQSSL
jgi:hypothetical protein